MKPLRILALSKYGTGAAATRQRILLYREHLESVGFALDLAPLVPDSAYDRIAAGRRIDWRSTLSAYLTRLKTLRGAGNYDLLWLQYDAFPYLPALLENLAMPRSVPMVTDIDDANFHLYDRHPNPAVRRLLEDKFAHVFGNAAAAICGNEYLAEYARRHCRQVHVVPTVVDTQRVRPADRKQSGAPVTVGWIGSPSTWRGCMVPMLEPILATVGGMDARFLAVGGGPSAHGIAGVTARDWEEERETADIQSMDIGVMPLNDTPFERGKCGYKLIQYMACGLPTIASPVGVNAEIVVDGVTGFIAKTPAEWREALERLVQDPDLRSRMGAAGRQRAVERYSLAAQQDRVAAILRSAASKERERG